MRIYKAYYGHNNGDGGDTSGTELKWFGTKREAQQHLDNTDLAESIPSGITPYDIPATKEALLRWLNAVFTTDNG